MIVVKIIRIKNNVAFAEEMVPTPDIQGGSSDVFGDSSKGLLVQRRLWKRVFIRGYSYSDAYGSAYCIMIQIRDNHSLALSRLGFETGA